MEKKFRVGVIGCGQIAQMMHIPYIAENTGFEIVGLCDISASVLSELADRYRLPADRLYTNYNEMLEKAGLDLVVITTRDHYAPSIAASRARVCQVIEKPLALNLRQASEMVEAARENGVWIALGYMKCYDPNAQHFASLVRAMPAPTYVCAHDFGGSMAYTDVVYDLTVANDLPESLAAEGMASMNALLMEDAQSDELLPIYFLMLLSLSHDLALLKMIFGKPNGIRHASTCNGVLTVVFDYGRFSCILEGTNYKKRTFWDEKLTVYSEDCELSLKFPWPYLKNAPSTIYINENEADTLTNVEKTVVASYDEAYRCEWREFYACLTEGRRPAVDGESGLEDIRIFNDVLQALRTNREK